MMRFDGRVAIVTGSGSGLGAAYSSLLAQRGASVVVHDAGVSAEGSGGDPSVADRVVAQITGSGGTAIASYQNLSSREACQQVVRTAIDRFGRLDILIHNAGLLSFTALEETSPELFERMCQVHVSAPFWLSQAAWPHMQHQRYGRMVFTTSGRALTIESAQPGLSVYAMGKIASLGLMHVLALEGEPWGIRVNAIAPVAATRMLQRQVGHGEFTPEDVAPGVAYLASSCCDRSGIILRAQNGYFATGGWSFNSSVKLAPGEITPEAVAQQFHDMSL